MLAKSDVNGWILFHITEVKALSVYQDRERERVTRRECVR